MNLFGRGKLSLKVLGHGLASTVRLCIEKGTGLEFAVKIVDISTERQSEAEARRLYNETISEVNLLRQLSGHPSISEFSIILFVSLVFFSAETRFIGKLFWS